MKKSRLVWLGAFVALMAMLGTSALSPKAADAATASVWLCKAGTGTAVGTQFSFNAAAGGAGQTVTRVAGTVAAPNCAILVDGANLTGPVAVAIQENIPAGFRVSNIEVSNQAALTNLATNIATGSVAFNIAAGSTGRIDVTYTNEPGTGPVCVGANCATFISKECRPALPDGVIFAGQVRVGDALRCTVTLGGTLAGLNQLTAVVEVATLHVPNNPYGVSATEACGNPPTIAPGFIATVNSNLCDPPAGVTGRANVALIHCEQVIGNVCRFEETIGPTVACAPIRERIWVFRRDFPNLNTEAGRAAAIADTQAVLVTDTRTIIEARNVLPKGAGDCEAPSKTVTKVCDPTAPDGVPFPAYQVRVGQSITCRVNITDPAVGAGPVAGRAEVTLTNATFAGGANPVNFNCVSISANTCQFTETIFPTEPGCLPISERIRFFTTTGLQVLDVSPPIANASGRLIEVLPKVGGDCGTVSPSAILSTASKICTPNVEPQYVNLGVLNCDLFLTTLTGTSAGPIPGNAEIDVVLRGPANINLDAAGLRDVLVVSGCDGASIVRRAASTNPVVEATPTATTFTIKAPPGGCPIGTTIQVSQKLRCTANITPGSLTETATLYRVIPGGREQIGSSVTAILTGPGGQPLSQNCPTAQAATASKTCQPIVDGVPAATATQVFTRVGQTVSCTVTITGVVGGVSPAGPVTVSLLNATFAGTQFGTGTTATITCNAIAAATSGAPQCSFNEVFVPTVACTTLGQTITSTVGGPFSFVFNPITVGPSSPTTPTGAQIFVLPKDESGVLCPGQVTGFAGNDLNFVLRCTTATGALGDLAAAVQGVVPGPIGGANVLALGVLPAAIVCEAGFLAPGDAATAPFRPAAPGTIEASSLNGTLIDLRGGVTTNLRIVCGGAAATNLDNPIGVTVDPNTCRGVRFGVLGLGVGFTEVRARYEPSSAAAAAGIREREASGQVAFVAPSVAISLLLNPNPVGVGQTGTATARFNRNAIFADELLVNPSTGAPLFVNLGTPLNGTVVFSSSNPNVASFTGGLQTGGQSVTGIVPGTGVLVGTGASVSVRCGSSTSVFAGAGLPQITTAATFAGFFGGCTDASAAYRGNEIGSTTITATFQADLPNAFGSPVLGGFNNVSVTGTGGTVGGNFGNVGALFNLFGGLVTNSAQANLDVVQLLATTTRLVPGCNNVVAPANETVAQVAARVDPASAVISVWKQIPGTVMFQGAAIGTTVPAGVSNLASLNALDAFFICVNAAATYRIT